MNIIFDIFIEYPELVAIVNKIPEQHTFYKEILIMVESRLKPLQNEIEKEENDNEIDGLCTIIFILRNDRKFIDFFGYSEKLILKMNACFSKSDFNQLINKIAQINIIRNN